MTDDASRPVDAATDPGFAGVSAPPPPPSPFRGLPTGAGSVLRLTFDLLTRSGPELRRASFYIGLIVVGLVAPVALLAWGFEVALPTETAYSDVISTQESVNGAA
ncbi:MAG TPA: hypothetical protein VKA85_08340, partial [Candidatus Limnocylindrales bacterium]|nr:hypothetical protein [Candidatus Limnocylindrales bacterium]